MVADEIGTVALMSIHPRYSQRILFGKKTVEFRKRALKKDVTHVVVYETSPTKRVVGFFVVEAIDQSHPSEIWRKYARQGGVASHLFWEYFRGRETAAAIRIKDVVALPDPIGLEDVLGKNSPPQSYCYITNAHFQRVLDQIPDYAKQEVSQPLG